MFPWQVGALEAPSYRRVIKGSGFADPTANFLSQRDAETRHVQNVHAAQRTANLHTKVAWEVGAKQRLDAARDARDEARSRQTTFESKASRRAMMQDLYQREWSGWIEASEQLRRDAASPPLETLRERVAKLQTARETERAQAASEALDRRAFEASDTARALSAQARLEAVAGAWEMDNEAKALARRQREEAAQNFQAHWTPRVAPPQAPDETEAAALRAGRILSQGALRTAWEGQRGEQAVAAEVDAARDKAFLHKWVGIDKDPDLTEDNMYIWRGDAAVDDDDEDETDAGGNGEHPPPASVSANITLDMNFEATCGNPEAQAAFEAQFIADMAQQLGCDPSMLQINGLQAGSIVVNFQIAGSSVGGGPTPSDLLNNLKAAVEAGGVVVAGGGATKMVDLTPSKEALAKQQQRLAQRKAYDKYVQDNARLMEYRSVQKAETAAGERAEELGRVAADAASLELERVKQQRRQEEERHLAQLAWEEQRASEIERAAAIKLEVAEEAARLAAGGSSPELIWQRAEAELQRRQSASSKLKAEVQAGLEAQLTARREGKERALEGVVAERAAFAEEQRQLEGLARAQQDTKRDQEQVWPRPS
jgi:hypothetical protein